MSTQAPDLYTNCPDCKGRINITAALHKFLETAGYETIPHLFFYLSLWCDGCGEYTMALCLQPEATIDQQKKRIIFDTFLKDVLKPPKAD